MANRQKAIYRTMMVLKLAFVYKGGNKFFAHNPAESILGLQSLCMKPGKIIKELVMIDKSNKPDLTHIDAASSAATTQQKIPCVEGGGSNPVPFRVQASVNLYAVAEFIVEAANQEEAKATAEKILDPAYFNITRDLNGGLNFYVPVHPERVETQVLEVEKSSSSLPSNTEGLRAAVQAVIGQSVLAEMECRQSPQEGLVKNRDNILAAFDDWEDDARYHMAMWVWRAYLRLYPEQAVKDEHENHLVRFGL